MTLRASLEGAFGNVAAAKAAGAPGLGRVIASPVHVTDGTLAKPVSTLLIPADAASGVYNLTFTIAFAGGSQSATSAIHVAR